MCVSAALISIEYLPEVNPGCLAPMGCSHLSWCLTMLDLLLISIGRDMLVRMDRQAKCPRQTFNDLLRTHFGQVLAEQSFRQLYAQPDVPVFEDLLIDVMLARLAVA